MSRHRRMKLIELIFGATLLASVAALGQGQFLFNTRVDARFVLNIDPPGTSSVGLDFKVQLFGGPEGTVPDQMAPLDPQFLGFRGPAGSATAGYVIPALVTVPRVSIDPATVLVRVFNSASWETANYRFEGTYTVQLIEGLPAPIELPMGTSPLVLQPVPEPSLLLLAMVGLAGLGVVRTGVHSAEPANSPTPGDAPLFQVRPSRHRFGDPGCSTDV